MRNLLISASASSAFGASAFGASGAAGAGCAAGASAGLASAVCWDPRAAQATTGRARTAVIKRRSGSTVFSWFWVKVGLGTVRPSMEERLQR
ncbi:MAG: hypothetical protein FJ270_05305 [Planctomycetes bacterium]|nr:hypothetical protein [Planctomycetota bacterium]